MLPDISTVPPARVDSLVVSDAGPDLLVYDRRSNHIHHLNAAAARIWRACDGRRTCTDVARVAGISPADCEVVIDRLQAASLLDDERLSGAPASRTTRRRFLRRAAVAGGVALPIIISVSAPTAASTSSTTCGPFEQFCALDGKCFNPEADGCCTTADCTGSFCYGGSCRDGYDSCVITADCYPGLVCLDGTCFDPLRPEP